MISDLKPSRLVRLTTARDAAGRVRYVPVLAWPDKQTADRFSAAVVAAVAAQHPGAVRP